MNFGVCTHPQNHVHSQDNERDCFPQSFLSHLSPNPQTDLLSVITDECAFHRILYKQNITVYILSLSPFFQHKKIISAVAIVHSIILLSPSYGYITT